MKPTPDTQTSEPATAEAPTTKAADSGADLTKTDTKADTKTDAKTPDAKTPDAKTATKAATETDAPAATETDAPAGNEAEEPAAVPAAASVTDADGRTAGPDNEIDLDDADADVLDSGATVSSSGLGAAAAAVVAVCLGIVALTGTWTGKVLAERQGLIGQLKTGQTATAEQQISAIYGDAWHATAAINGGVALAALVIGAIVLALPQRTAWVRPVAVAGAVIGFLGLLVSVGMYFDLFVAMPTTGS